MLSDNEIKDLVAESRKIKAEVAEIRKELDKVNEVKEEWYSKKEEFSKEIVQLISEIKKFRKVRDELTKNVKDSKKKRTEMNDIINQKIAEIKGLQEQRAKEQGGERINVGALKKELEGIQFKLETQPMSFDAEQKLMKRSKSIKKTLDETDSNSDLNKKIRDLSKEIDELKKEADEVHAAVQKNAKESQEKHEEMITFSKKIDELKVKEEEAYKAFLEHKKHFSEINDKLKDKLKELAPITKKLDAHTMETSDKKQKVQETAIKEKQVSVEEKIQKGQKLTTEDLLVFQKMNQDE
ncbi:MAG: coiled-coil protein [Nanoarchaeota archaeon]